MDTGKTAGTAKKHHYFTLSLVRGESDMTNILYDVQRGRRMTPLDWMQSWLFIAEITAMNAPEPIEDMPRGAPGIGRWYDMALSNAIGWASR